jgi:transglutaminase/protease-like cytokinesis protein 3
MKKTFYIFLFLNLIFLNFSYSQKYNSVDSIVLKYPKHFDTPKLLANQIQKDFTSEYEKSRAVFTWMALNIAYDVKTWQNPKPPKYSSYTTQLEKDLQIQEVNNDIVKTVFRKQLAVCEGYALLFNHLATLVGLKSEVIHGMAKTTLDDIGRKKTKTDHAWNTVMIDGVWRLIDVTWGAGMVVNKQNLWVREFNPIYFDTAPKIFFSKHLPVSGVWQNEILDEQEFLKAPLLYEPFFASGYEIMEPKSGIIEAVENQKIIFKIKNLSHLDNLFYIDKSEVSINIKFNKDENNVLDFDIVYSKKIGRYLILYVNGKSIAAFKIIPKYKAKSQ